MKFRTLFMSTLAALALLVAGCAEEEKDSDIPSLKVSSTELTVTPAGGAQTFQVTSNRPWKIENTADWLAVDPVSGKASADPVTVTVTALPNSGYDRTASLKVSMDFDYKTVTVSQAGELGPDESKVPSGTGTADDPYNVIAAQALALEVGEEGSGNVYVKGIVSSISTTTLSSFGNIDYYISTDGTTENQFYVYRGLYLGGNQFTSLSQLKVGDEVVIYGKVVNFKGNTPELTQGNYLYSLNGQTSGGGIDYENCEEKTVEQFIAIGNDGNYYKLTGTVSRFNATYCSFDLTDASGTIYVYSVANKDDWSDKIKNGGTVTLAGKYEYYSQKSQHEVVNAQILSFTEGGDEPGGETAEPKTVTIAEFNAAEESSTQPYRLTGTIGGNINTTYGNFDLTDETGTVYVYGLTATNLGYGASNDKSYASLGLKAGDKVTLIGFRGSFNDKIEVMYAYYVSHEAGEGGDEPGGEIAEPKTVTIAEFNAAEESSTQPYQLTGTIGGSINTTYGNFDLTDETGTVYVYGLTATNLGYGASNDKSYASLGLKAGDKVTLIGFRGSFNDKIEVMYAYYVSHEAGEGGDEPGLEDDFTSNVTWTLGTNAYSQDATVNGTEGVSVLKLGTSSKVGDATLSIPKGTTKVTFYAVSWTNKPTKLVAKVGGTEIYSVDPAVNSGATGNPTYTLTVASSDKYTMDLGSALEADTEVTVTTSGSNTRVIIFAIKAE